MTITKSGWIAAAILLLAASSLRAVEIRLHEGVVEATGLDAKLAAKAELSLRVDEDGDLPQIAGKSEVHRGIVRFTPAFPLVKGMSYRAELNVPDGESVTSIVSIPKEKQKNETRITKVYPSAKVLPENLLKFYIHFSSPMRAGGNYRHIRLLDSGGKPVDLPFLELDEELWDRDHRRLTVFLDPARIKRGLVPHEKEGRALRAGETYTLVVGKGFTDARNANVVGEFRKTFKVSAPDYDQPLMKNWKILAPAAGTRRPVVIDFGEPLDHGLLQRVVRIKNTEGAVRTSMDDARWEFVPDQPWKAGVHSILVDTILEDLAGNSLQRPFEVLPGLPFIENLKETESLDFEVLPSRSGEGET